METKRFVVPEDTVAIMYGICVLKRKFWIFKRKTYIAIPEDVTEIVIPDSVAEIGNGAFFGYSSVVRINIPRSVTKIDRYAFNRCPSLAEIKVSAENPVFHDEDGVLFEGTALRRFPAGKKMQSYSIPESVTEFRWQAFEDCSLTEIVIPGSIEKIGDEIFDVFLDCPSLAAIKVSAKNPVFHDEDGVLFRGTVLWRFPFRKNVQTYNVPGHVTEISFEAFSKCSQLTEVNIPDSVTKIGHGAFENCSSLTSIIIPKSVTEIEWLAFEGCSSLTKIIISDSVTRIGSGAFLGCPSLETVYAPRALDLSKTEIPPSATIVRS